MKQPHSILVFHNNPERYDYLNSHLSEFWPESCIDEVSSWDAFHAKIPRLELDESIFILSDPFAEADQVERLRYLAPLSVIVVCSPQEEVDRIVAYIRAGADDYCPIRTGTIWELRKKLESSRMRKRNYIAANPSRHQPNSEVLHALYDISLALTGVLSTQDLIEIVYERLKHFLQPDTFVAAVHDSAQKNYSVFFKNAADAKILDNVPKTLHLDPTDEANSGLTGYMIREKLPLHIRDMATYDGGLEWIQLTESPSLTWLGAPLVVQNQVVGAISIHSFEKDAFDDDQVDFFHAVVNQIGLAMHGGQLHEAEQSRRRYAEILHRVSGQLMNAQEEDLFDYVVSAVREIFPDTVDISFNLLDKPKENLVRTHVWFAKPEYDVLGERAIFPLKGIKIGKQVLDEVRTIAVPDLHRLGLTYEEDSPLQIVISNGVRAAVCVPLVVKGAVIGLVSVVFWYWPRHATPAEIQCLEAIVGHVATAMENQRLYDALDLRVFEVSVLRDVAMVCASSTNLDELIGEATRLVANALYAEDFGVYLIDQEAQQLVAHPSYMCRSKKNIKRTLPISESVIGQRCVLEKMPFRAGNLPAAEESQYQLESASVRSWVAAPVIIEDKVVAVLNAQSRRFDLFDEGDVEFFRVLAGQMSTAWQRVQLHEKTKNQAAELSIQVEKRTAELQSERDLMQIILQSAGEGILFTDIDGVIRYANPAMALQSGFTAAELIGQQARILGSGETAGTVFEEMWPIILSGSRWRGELINRHKDGRLYTIAMIITPIVTNDQHVVGFVSVQSDITQPKEVERLKSEFVSNVSHELRTPLTNINMYITLLKRGRTDKHERYFDVLGREAQRLTSLIQDLLTLSRLETNKLFEPEPISLIPLLQQTIQDFEAQAQSASIDLQLHMIPYLPLILGDDGQIRQVLINLVANALAYTSADGRVQIWTEMGQRADRHMVLVHVSDTGLGISKTDLPHLFDRFYRGQAAQKTNKPGTGLGLAICKEIMERHNGGIEVTSSVGEGTRFTVYFPISYQK